jgi:hypothetical protein
MKKNKKQKRNPMGIFIFTSQNEKGVALVMVLVLSAISLGIMAGLVYMLTSGTQISGIQKRYKTALEASEGGSDVMFQLISARGDPLIPGLTNFSIPAENVGGVDCLTDKLNNPTADWDAACDNTLSIVSTAVTSYDMTFQLGTGPTYTVFSKIADTVEGNSGGDMGLTKGGVVASNSGEVTVMSIPYLYTIELESQNTAIPAERGKLSVLYEY